MKKIIIKCLAVFLCLTTIISIIPLNVFAKDSNSSASSSSENEFEIANSTSFGKILNNTISAGDGNDLGYSIVSLEITNKKAEVEFTNPDECILVVSIYDEKTNQLLASGISEINEIDVGSAMVDIEIGTMPTYFIARAFLLDSDYSALCEQFETKHYTKAFEEFYEKTPQDFDPERTIIVDDSDEKIDFAVVDSTVNCISDSSRMTMSYDEDKMAYVFKNATDEIKSLSVGDKLFYQYGEEECEFVILKIKTKSVSGSTVTITEDENIGLSDVFEYINIEADGDYSNAYVDEEQLDDCYTLLNKGITTQDIDYNGNETFSVNAGVEHVSKSESGTLSGKISGTLGITLSVTAKVYYDAVLFGKDYYECKVTTETNIGFTVLFEGKVTAFAGKRIPIPYINVGGIFDFEINISPDISFAGNGTWKGMLVLKTVVSYDSVNDLNKSQTTDTKIDPDISAGVEVKIGAKIEFKLALYIPPHAKQLKIKPYIETWSLAFSVAGGLKISAKTENIEPKHPCKPCISGVIRVYAEIAGNMKLCLVPKVLDFNFNVKPWSKEWYLADFYFSLFASPVFKMGKGVVCPNRYHDVNVTVKDADGNLLKNVEITADNCICDAEGDGKYNDTKIKTNSDGKATICLKKGTHKVKATYEGSTQEKTVDVLEIAKSVVFIFDLSPNDPVDPTPPDGDETGNVKWKYDSPTKTLTIYGTGKMDNYSTYGVSPWDKYKDEVKNIVIESGVTGVGSYAFAQHMKAEKVTIADTVKEIGMAAFYQCDAIQAVTLPNSVKVVDDYAFYGCYSMKTLNLGNVERIGAYAFAQCTALENVTVPMATTNIGDSAFAWCQGLKSITFFNKNCSIYDSANTIWQETEILAPLGSKAQSYANKYGRTFSSIVVAGVVDTTEVCDAHSITVPSCVAGNDYILLNVTGYSAGFELSTTNLEYIDQLTADNNGVVNTSFIPRRDVAGSTTLLIGDFGNGVEVKVVTPKFLSVDIEIVNNPGTKTINYGEGIRLYATATDAAGYTIKWYVNGTEYCTGDTFEYRSLHDDIEVTVKLVDSNGNPVVKDGSEISENETINVKDGFFQKLAAFFKFTLFRQVVIKTN